MMDETQTKSCRHAATGRFKSPRDTDATGHFKRPS